MNRKAVQTAGYFGAFFTLGAVIASLGPTLSGVASNVNRSPAEVGFLFSIRSLGYLSGSLLGGYLLERLTSHLVMGPALLLAGLMLFLLPGINFLTLLLLLLFIIGVSLGAIDVGSNTMLTRLYQRESGPYLNAMYLIAGAGSFLIPLALGVLDLNSGYLALALLTAGVGVYLLLTPSPASPTEEKSQAQGDRQLFYLAVFCLLAFLFVGIEISYGGWIFTFFIEKSLGVQQAAYTITSLFWIAITLGRLISIPVSTLLEPSVNIFLLLFVGLLSAGLMSLFPEQTWTVWAGTAGVGFGLSALFPTTFRHLQRISNLQTSSYGLVWASGSLGGIALPWVIGEAFQELGPVSLMTITLMAWALALALFALLSLHHRQDRH